MIRITNKHGTFFCAIALALLTLASAPTIVADDYVPVPVNISFLPGLDINVSAGAPVVNNFSYGFLGAGMGMLNGLAISCGFTLIDNGGWGMVVSGIFSVCGGDFAGLIASGIFNVTGGIFSGVQVAGIFNSANIVYGMQVGIVNVAQKVAGVQIGLINIAETMDGLAIGLLNLSKDKLMYFTSWYDEADMFNIGLQLRLKPWTFMISSGIKSTLDVATAGVGLGYRIALPGDGALFVDGLAQYIFPQNAGVFPDLKNIPAMLYSARIGIEFGTGYFNVYVGLSYNFYELYDSTWAVPFSWVHQLNFLSQYYTQDQWPGFFVGVIF